MVISKLKNWILLLPPVPLGQSTSLLPSPLSPLMPLDPLPTAPSSTSPMSSPMSLSSYDVNTRARRGLHTMPLIKATARGGALVSNATRDNPSAGPGTDQVAVSPPLRYPTITYNSSIIDAVPTRETEAEDTSWEGQERPPPPGSVVVASSVSPLRRRLDSSSPPSADPIPSRISSVPSPPVPPRIRFLRRCDEILRAAASRRGSRSSAEAGSTTTPPPSPPFIPEEEEEEERRDPSSRTTGGGRGRRRPWRRTRGARRKP